MQNLDTKNLKLLKTFLKISVERRRIVKSGKQTSTFSWSGLVESTMQTMKDGRFFLYFVYHQIANRSIYFISVEFPEFHNSRFQFAVLWKVFFSDFSLFSFFIFDKFTHVPNKIDTKFLGSFFQKQTDWEEISSQNYWAIDIGDWGSR